MTEPSWRVTPGHHRAAGGAIHDQVRAWAFTFGLSPAAGPVATLGGKRVRLTRTSLVDLGGEARRVETGDGPLWVVSWEPLA
jgi:methionyl-tRNA formyltransferase